MATAVAAMSTITTTHTIERTKSPEAGPSGFTAVNGSSPGSGKSSVTSSGQITNRSAGTSDSRETSPRDENGNSTTSSTSPIQLNGQEQAGTKRKRSHSIEEHSPRRYDYSPPKRGEHPKQMADRALHVLDQHAPPAYYANNGGGENGYTYDKPYNSVPSTQQSTPEGRLAEAFQREGRDHQRYLPHVNSMDNESDDHQDQDGDRPTVVQIGPKRKRNFSNRTKTGCLTCRTRKKKCDEGRPACNNCLRGGFSCAGYSIARPPWPKPPTTKAPVPLQSKDGHDEPSPYPPENETPVSAHPSHEARVRPPMMEESRTPYPAPSQPVDTRPPYGQPSWPSHPPPPPPPPLPQQQQPQQQQQQSSQTQHSYDHLPSLSEIARDSNSDYSKPPSRDMSRPAPTQSAPPPPPPPPPQPPTNAQQWGPPQPEYRQSFVPQRMDHQPPPPMRMPSTYDSQKPGAKTFTMEEIERSRMLRNTSYKYFDATLKNERQRCAQALARYNNACMLGSGVSDREAHDMLAKVFDPSLDHTHSFIAPCKEKGILSNGVKIEGAFKCTYGYNIRIMDNVFIGENVRIDDTAKVDIGPRTWIGPNVTVLTNDVSKDMVDRKGTEATCVPHPVRIASEVVIGAGAVIYPGVTLSRGSTVAPFAIVTSDLGENQTQLAAIGPRT